MIMKIYITPLEKRSRSRIMAQKRRDYRAYKWWDPPRLPGVLIRPLGSSADV